MWRFSLILMILLLFGCVSFAINITDQQKQQIKSVTVAPTVAVSEEAQFIAGIGPLLVAAGRFKGGAGHVAADSLEKSEHDSNRKFANFLRENNIDVGDIFRGEFIKYLMSDNFFGPKLKPPISHSFELEVLNHALVQKSTLSNNFRPSVFILIRLKGLDGAIVAQGRGSSGLFSDNIPFHTLSELGAKPALLKEAFAKAFAEAIDEIMKGMKQ